MDDLYGVAELLAGPEVMRYVSSGEARACSREEAEKPIRVAGNGHGLRPRCRVLPAALPPLLVDGPDVKGR